MYTLPSATALKLGNMFELAAIFDYAVDQTSGREKAPGSAVPNTTFHFHFREERC